MIGSPSESIENYKKELQLKKWKDDFQTEDHEIQCRTELTFRIDSIISYFVRMSWINKLNFLRNLNEKINSLQTMTILLNTLYANNSKSIMYCRTLPTTLIYDEIPIDHNRMLNEETLEETVITDFDWFANLDDKNQISCIIRFLHYSGGALIRFFYTILLKTYSQLILSLPQNPDDTNPNLIELVEAKYDPNNPNHEKVIKLQKEWNKKITKLKKQIDKKKPKLPKPAKPKSKKNNKKKKKKKKGSSKKSKKKSKDDFDWLQLLPIRVTKEIFNYLDKQSLNKAKQVNNYWKWVISELQKDIKVQKFLNKTNLLVDQNTGNNSLSSDIILVIPKPKLTHSEKRLKRLRLRGAILEEFRPDDTLATNKSTIFTKVFKNLISGPLSNNLVSFPRVLPSPVEIYKYPEYIINDLNFITKVTPEMLECLSEVILSDSETYTNSNFDQQ